LLRVLVNERGDLAPALAVPFPLGEDVPLRIDPNSAAAGVAAILIGHIEDGVSRFAVHSHELGAHETLE
jgi:hypothetical protein